MKSLNNYISESLNNVHNNIGIYESLNNIGIYESLNNIGIYESLRIGINDSPEEDIVFPFLEEFFNNMPESLDNEDNLIYFWPMNGTSIKPVETELCSMLNNVINTLDNPLDNIVKLNQKQIKNPGYYILLNSFTKRFSKKEDLLPERLYISNGENVYIIGIEYDYPIEKGEKTSDGLICVLNETVQTISNGIDAVFFEGEEKAVYISCYPELNEINKLFV